MTPGRSERVLQSDEGEPEGVPAHRGPGRRLRRAGRGREGLREGDRGRPAVEGQGADPGAVAAPERPGGEEGRGVSGLM